ncbi:MAG TPA: CHASE domain-containing protein, partial [Dongiaceae bacterium]|nr:CHASE domain-containing protein [Dongiaceae bacterium]
MLGGLSLAWRVTGRAARARLFADAVMGSVIASAGFSTLLGYWVDLPAVFSWGTATATAPVAAFCLMLLGLALTALAWRETIKAEGGPPAWSPMPAVIFCLTLTVILWIGLRARERAFIGTTTQSATTQLAQRMDSELEIQTNQFERIARNWSARSEDSTEVWQADATQQMSDSSGLRGCVSIAFVDARTLRTVWVYPPAGNEAAINFDHRTVEERLAAIETARRPPGAPAVSGTTTIFNPARNTREEGCVIYAPVQRGGQTIGFVAAEFSYRQLFGYLANAVTTAGVNLANRYNIVIAVNGARVFPDASVPVIPGELTLDKTYTI